MRPFVLSILAGCSFPHGSITHDAPPIGDDDDAALDAAIDSAGDKQDASTCPVGFAPLNGAPATSKYKAFGAQSFTSAVQTCISLGTHLVRLDTQNEANAIYIMIDAATGTGDTHLYRIVGQRDKTVVPNNWLDLDGTPLSFLPWGIGEPTNGTSEDCIMVRLETAMTTKVIGADQCTTNHEFACECE